MARQVQALDDSITKISPVLSHTPGSTSPNVHRMEDLIATKIDLENEIMAGSAKLAEITRTVNSMSNTLHVVILTCRYFSRMEWQEIAAELYISESQVYRQHRAALVEIEKMIAGDS